MKKVLSLLALIVITFSAIAQTKQVKDSTKSSLFKVKQMKAFVCDEYGEHDECVHCSCFLVTYSVIGNTNIPSGLISVTESTGCTGTCYTPEARQTRDENIVDYIKMHPELAEDPITVEGVVKKK